MNRLAESVVKEISEQLLSSYIFLDVAEQCVTHLQAKLAAGFYHVDDMDTLATRLTQDLQAVSHDKHLNVHKKRSDSLGSARFTREASAKQNHGFRKVKVLDDNIGYIDFHCFASPEWAAETVIGAMRFVANTDALIIDLRKNGGGDPNLISLMCSYFFSERTLLNSLYWRYRDFTEQYWTLPYVAGPLYIDKPLYLLTSSYTFSGAEEFAYNLQNLNRAQIIGEVTGGGAHPGDVIDLSGELAIFVPQGRAISPITKDNWEGKGVIPDIETPANDALNVALKEIRLRLCTS